MTLKEIQLSDVHVTHIEQLRQCEAASELIAGCKAYLAMHQGYIRELHDGRGLKDSDVCRTMSKGIDLLLQFFFERYQCAGHFTLCAIGGYGRGIMNPASDVDVLLLLPKSSISKQSEAVINEFLTPLWDIGLKIGHSVRDVAACLDEAEKDPFNRTAMLDSRFLAGDEEAFESFSKKYWSQRVEKQQETFFEERFLDMQRRHEKFSNTIFLQEPNVKESPGGLRDFQNLIWIAQVMRGTTSFQKLVEEGTMTAKRRKELKEAFRFLHRVRTELHFQSSSGRANDILTLQLQGVLADAFGYPEDNILRRIESFMKDYYRATRSVYKTVVSFGEIFNIEIDVEKKSGMFSFLQSWGKSTELVEFDGFELQGELLSTNNELVFEEKPVRLLQVFRYQQQYGVPLAPKLRQLIQRSLHLIDDRFRSNEVCTCVFRTILEVKGGVGSVLRSMHSNRVLGAYLPEFGALDCLVQHEFFHRYTADEHTLRCIDALDELADADAPNTIFKDLLKDHESPYAMYLALILHDTGRAEDIREHTDGSMVKADAVARRFKLSGGRRKLLMFLVDHHLTFWNVATKCDLSDPQVIKDFVRQMKNESNLDALLLFTYVDSKGTNEEGWGPWKEQLMLQLYRTAKQFLRKGEDTFLEEFKEDLPELEQRLMQITEPGWRDRVHFHVNNLPARYFRYRADNVLALHFKTMEQYADRRANSQKSFECAVQWIHYDESGYSELVISSCDTPKFLQKVCCCLAIEGVNILSADVFTRKDGVILDVFKVCTTDFKSARDIGESRRIVDHLYQLGSEDDYRPEDYLVTKRSYLEEEVTYTTMIPTQAVVNNELDPRTTIVEVQAVDRIGLLHDILHTIDEHDLIPIRARISTEKGAAIDWIYIKPKEGGRLTDEVKIAQLETDLQKLLHHQGDGAKVEES